MRTAHGGDQTFDSVVVTVSNREFLKMAPTLDVEYARKINDLPSQDALCLMLALDRSVTDYYRLNVNDRSVPFLSIVEHTNLIEPGRYGGRHMVYITSYMRPDSNPPEDSRFDRRAISATPEEDQSRSR